MKNPTFRAWIPDLKIMLKDVAIYGKSNMIGLGYDEFVKAIPDKHILDDDGVYHEDTENGISEKIIGVLTGEDWICLEEGQFELMQYINKLDKNNKDIYEFDVVKTFIDMGPGGSQEEIVTIARLFPLQENRYHYIDWKNIEVIGHKYQK